jgi:CHAT domain-containing protein/Tfp pilus assembly protein PilF
MDPARDFPTNHEEPAPVPTGRTTPDAVGPAVPLARTDNPTTAIRVAKALWEHGDHEGASELYEHALGLLADAGEDRSHAELLDSLGQKYAFAGRYPDSIVYFERAVAAWKKLGSKRKWSDSRHFLGVAQQADGDYPSALKNFEAALTVRSEYMRAAADTLTRIGNIHFQQARYASALTANTNALALWNIIGDGVERLAVLNTIGSIHAQLAQYDKAIDYLTEALTLARRLEEAKAIASALHNLGFTYSRRGDKSLALQMYQEGIAVRRRAGNELGVAFDLNDLGLLYSEMGDSQKALASLNGALAIFGKGESTNYIRGEGQALDSLGTVYRRMGDSDRAMDAYSQAMAVQRQLPDPAAQRATYANIAALYDELGESDFAILMYKRAVSTTEAIRADLATLPTPMQEQYAQSVQSVYRRLAQLLLEAGRVREARRVLDLLKLQELQDYLQAVEGNDDTARGVAQTDLETQAISEWIHRGSQAIQLGRELRMLREIDKSRRTPEQRRRIEALELLQQQRNRDFNMFLDGFEPGQTASLESLELNSLRDDLRTLDAVLLYPLVLEDRVELILVTSLTAPLRKQVRISRGELHAMVSEFRKQLRTPLSDASNIANQLYRVLFKPLEEELREAGTTNILYAPDDFLRYIPLAALHDGEAWLAERFSINNITSTSLINLDSRPPPRTTVLAGAFSNGYFEFPVEGEQLKFRGLPFAGKEVNDIAAKVPDTAILTDTGLTRSALMRDMDDHSIVHLATHAGFVRGRPEDSFVLLGDGDRITLADMRAWSLQNVSMIVLSACETGLGGFGDGREILGFGYLVEKAGVESAIASLWQIDDGGTRVFMSFLYDSMMQPGTSRLEAMSAAQRAMIGSGEIPAEEADRGVGTTSLGGHLGHPHYWAPFILIGNGT